MDELDVELKSFLAATTQQLLRLLNTGVGNDCLGTHAKEQN